MATILGLTRKTVLKRIAVLLSLVMIYETVAAPLAQAGLIAQPALNPAAGASLAKTNIGARPSEIADFVAPFKVPASVGTTVEIHAPAAAGRLIYHLQDVHNVVSAQTNLAEMVSRLETYAAEQKKSLIVAVEGGVGVIDTDSLSAYPSAETKAAVSSALLRNGFLLGEEYAAINKAPGRVKIIGVETPSLYNRNVLARERSAAARDRVLATVREIKDQLNRLKEHNFNSLLNTLENNRLAVEDGRMSMSDYLVFLSHTNPQLTRQYPMVSRMVALNAQEKSIDFASVEKEGRLLVEEVIGKKSDKEVEKMMKEATALREGRLSPLAYYTGLLAQADKIYPSLEAYVAYLRNSEAVNPDALFLEVQDLETEIAKDLVRHPIAYQLYKNIRWIERQERFFSLNMVPQEWAQQRGTSVQDIFKAHAEIRDFVAEQVGDLGYKFATPPFSMNDLRVATRGAGDFYRAAEARDTAMVSNLQKALNKYGKNDTIVAFVAGGFHTPGVTRLLREKGFAYEVIRPELETQVVLNKDLTYPDFKPQARLLPEHASTDFLRPASNLPNGGTEAVLGAMQSGGRQVPQLSRLAAALSSHLSLGERLRLIFRPVLFGRVYTGAEWAILGAVGLAAVAIIAFGVTAMIRRLQQSAKKEAPKRVDYGIRRVRPDDSGLDLTQATRLPAPANGGEGSETGSSVGLNSGKASETGAGVGGPALTPANLFDGVPADVVAGELAALKANVDAGVVSTPKHLAAVRDLLDLKQYQLFAKWDQPGTNDDKKKDFLDQAVTLDAYYPGGLKGYRGRVQQLAQEALANVNPLEGKTLVAPKGEELDGPQDPRFRELEQVGLKGANKIAWVLPAGGKGERLGLKNGIKPAVPLDLATDRTYMQEFISSILAIQEKSNRLNGENIPAALMIMASPDNRDMMMNLLDQPAVRGGMAVVELTGDNFERATTFEAGTGIGTIYVLSQGKVPAVKDVEGNFFTEPNDGYKIASEPHGHIDVHQLIALSGLDAKWEAEGRQHLVFIQDTNGPLRNAVLAGLGASIDNDWAFNFMVFTRKPKENYGLITEIRNPDGSVVAKANVEYVNADRSLAATGGDVADATGNSPFPGNPNQYIARIGEYRAALRNLSGLPELVALKKLQSGTRTRVEGNSQDIVWRFPADAVGTTKVSPRYFIFAPAKNKLADAAANEAAGKPAEGMQTAEAAYYQGQRLMLKSVGAHVDVDGVPVKIHGVTVHQGAFVSFGPDFAATTDELASKVKGEVHISNRSGLVLEGEGISIDGLNLDGGLRIYAGPGVTVAVKNLTVRNKGWELVPLSDAELADTNVSESLRIRGYFLEKTEGSSYFIKEPGSYVLDNSGLHKVGDASAAVQPISPAVPLVIGAILFAAFVLSFGHSPIGIDAAAGYVTAILGIAAAVVFGFGVISAVVARAFSVDIPAGTELAAIEADARFNPARVQAVADFAAQARRSAADDIKVVVVPGILAHVDPATRTLYVGSGLLKSTNFPGRVLQRIVLRVALRHELVHLSRVQLPATNAVFRFINEVIAYVLGTLAVFVPALLLFRNAGAEVRADRPFLNPILPMARMGETVRQFAAGLAKILFQDGHTATSSEVPNFVAVDVDSLDLGTLDDQQTNAFVRLNVGLDQKVRSQLKPGAEVVFYSASGDATAVSAVQRLVNLSNNRIPGVTYSFRQMEGPVTDVRTVFGAEVQGNLNDHNVIVLGRENTGFTNARFVAIQGVPHLALATFALTHYRDGEAALDALVQLFEALTPLRMSGSLTNDIMTEVMAKLSA